MAARTWGPAIVEQIHAALAPEDVLYLPDFSPFSFVLQPAQTAEHPDCAAYTLQWRFQVDELVLGTNWCADRLENITLEAIYLV